MASRAWGFRRSRTSRGSESALVKSTSLLGIVSVPVLSVTSVLTLLSRSKAVASLIKMCLSAAFPMPTIRAVGVASPMAQGQAMTNTATADTIA